MRAAWEARGLSNEDTCTSKTLTGLQAAWGISFMENEVFTFGLRARFSQAGDRCYSTYCSNRCCDFYGNECCDRTSTSIAAIAGVCVAGSITIIGIILMVNAYRQHSTRHIVHNNQSRMQLGLINPPPVGQALHTNVEPNFVNGPPSYNSHSFTNPPQTNVSNSESFAGMQLGLINPPLVGPASHTNVEPNLVNGPPSYNSHSFFNPPQTNVSNSEGFAGMQLGLINPPPVGQALHTNVEPNFVNGPPSYNSHSFTNPPQTNVSNSEGVASEASNN
ncbi:hypothetical protein RRG08_035660 [Elysia crispata]|uniref:Uncharacterized protein n=1 Tax=Elysia crispata TaxID=231223 RepID=A0AAE0YAH9_9GAST|nr:hypothetical protein RRG08_035660 [Elysia crispata]